MRGYKITAKYGPDTIKFELSIGLQQDTLAEALRSARQEAMRAFSLEDPMLHPEVLKVTVEEYYSD